MLICVVILKTEKQMSFLSNIFGSAPTVDFKSLASQGATIIDVRTPEERAMGYIKDSINIPIASLPQNYKTISKSKPVIVYCASGMRSASAKAFLEQNGFKEVYDGGGFRSLLRFLGE